MKKISFIFGIFILIYPLVIYAQDNPLEKAKEEALKKALTQLEKVSVEESTTEVEKTPLEKEADRRTEKITLDFKDADIRNVLRILSYKSGVNIVASPEVTGLVTVRLTDVDWETALDVILKTYDLGYERKGDIITVMPLDKLTERKKREAELSEVQDTITEIVELEYLDAGDVKKTLEPMLSPRGKISILEITGQAGWEFGGAELGKRARVERARISRSKKLVITDIPSVVKKLKDVIRKIDVAPLQILIETRIMEVSRDRLKDIGIDYGTGSTGAEDSTVSSVDLDKHGELTLGGQNLTSQITPSIFGPKATISGTEPFDTGLELVFKKLTGTQFEVILHALEEDVHTNTLSAPRIMTLNNQEAAILVGTKYPILTSEVSTEAATTVTTTLDYYQDIGIQLNVVPQVAGEDYINMIIHPAITSYTTTVGDNKYPIINTREAETQVFIKSGETIVIGGLLKDVKSEGMVGIPFLSKIPLLGFLFQRRTTDIEKIDLLIFITATIIRPEEKKELSLAK